MATKSDKKAMTGTPVISLLILGAVLSFIALIVFGKIEISNILQNNRILGAKQKALDTLNNNLSAYPSLASAYDNLGDTRTLVNNSLPPAANYEDIVASFERIAAESGVKLKSMQPGLASTITNPKTGVSQVRFTASVEGPFTAYMAFLSALEVSSRPFRVETMSTRATPAAITSDIEIVSYYQEPVEYKLGTETVK